MKQCFFILNPKSGSEKGAEIEDAVLSKLEENFDIVTTKATNGAGDATEYARYAAENRYDCICSYGGDGTLNEILQGLRDFPDPPALAILPGGTGNLLSQMFQIPQDKKTAIANMDFSRTLSTDLGVTGDHVFSLFLSIGAIPEAIHGVSPEEKTEHGMLAYVKETFRRLRKPKTYNLRITTENETFEGKVDHMIISLTNSISFLKYSSRNGAMDNGYASIFILQSSSFFEKVGVAGRALVGKVEEDKNIRYIKARHIRIESMDEDVETDLDGEKGPALPLDVEILQGKITVFLPKNYKEA
ncbi:diacylglycerol/lipid kinase family protein [Peptoniphilaceae bacterium SGI.097]